MSTWEYLIIGLPTFESAKTIQGQSRGVDVLNQHGASGWEAVGFTQLADETVAVLLKRPIVQGDGSSAD